MDSLFYGRLLGGQWDTKVSKQRTAGPRAFADRHHAHRSANQCGIDREEKTCDGADVRVGEGDLVRCPRCPSGGAGPSSPRQQ